MPALTADVDVLDVDGVRAVVLGSGGPVTVFAHGLGGSSVETRPLAARVAGTRVLLEFRGHGGSAALEGGWTYDQLAHDLLAVADATGATGAVGLSLGSGALLRLLASQPDRFDRIALVLPAALDATRADGATVRLQQLGAAIDRGDVQTITELLLGEVPLHVCDRRGTRLLVARRAAQLVERPSPQPRHDDRPVSDRRALRRVVAAALVVAQDDDPLHRLEVARDVAAALPHAALLELPAGGVFWTAARDLQSALADHLADDSGAA